MTQYPEELAMASVESFPPRVLQWQLQRVEPFQTVKEHILLFPARSIKIYRHTITRGPTVAHTADLRGLVDYRFQIQESVLLEGQDRPTRGVRLREGCR